MMIILCAISVFFSIIIIQPILKKIIKTPLIILKKSYIKNIILLLIGINLFNYFDIEQLSIQIGIVYGLFASLIECVVGVATENNS